MSSCPLRCSFIHHSKHVLRILSIDPQNTFPNFMHPEHSLISRNRVTAGTQFKDLLSSMFTMPSFGGDDDDEDEDERPRGRRR